MRLRSPNCSSSPASHDPESGKEPLTADGHLPEPLPPCKSDSGSPLCQSSGRGSHVRPGHPAHPSSRATCRRTAAASWPSPLIFSRPPTSPVGRVCDAVRLHGPHALEQCLDDAVEVLAVRQPVDLTHWVHQIHLMIHDEATSRRMPAERKARRRGVRWRRRAAPRSPWSSCLSPGSGVRIPGARHVALQNRISEGEAELKEVAKLFRCRLFEPLLPSPDLPLALCECGHL